MFPTLTQPFGPAQRSDAKPPREVCAPIVFALTKCVNRSTRSDVVRQAHGRFSEEVCNMESIVGVFNSLPDAQRAAAVLKAEGIPDNRISVIAPGTSEKKVETSVATSET